MSVLFSDIFHENDYTWKNQEQKNVRYGLENIGIYYLRRYPEIFCSLSGSVRSY